MILRVLSGYSKGNKCVEFLIFVNCILGFNLLILFSLESRKAFDTSGLIIRQGISKFPIPFHIAESFSKPVLYI